ncbi:MAG: 2-amino-4-hydroxy-6-hydroxymethyldihydropteridine diphosphokinase [Lysobacter spongiicola]|nr:2-amino-4-hydroxy-6-hydroxymethyldihydropteridine diphosphokinase [Lysobacter spongiicola]
MSTPVVAFVGLGSNLGDSVGFLEQALLGLDAIPGSRLLRRSRLYRTPAWGLTDQPDFLNAVAMLQTTLPARELLQELLELEREAGRVRREDGADRWGPRTLDLDLLMHGRSRLDEAGLCVPHPRLHERAFVLLPMLEIAPEVVVPGRGPARELLDAMDADGIEALPYVDPLPPGATC